MLDAAEGDNEDAGHSLFRHVARARGQLTRPFGFNESVWIGADQRRKRISWALGAGEGVVDLGLCIDRGRVGR